jgi:hypothetical protein
VAGADVFDGESWFLRIQAEAFNESLKQKVAVGSLKCKIHIKGRSGSFRELEIAALKEVFSDIFA